MTVYSRPGNIVREFLRPGRSPIFISSADLLHTAVLPVLGRTVTQRQQVRSMMGPALSATNGDFFTIYGADGVEVAPGGIPVKGTSYYQPAIVIDDHRNPLISQVKLSIALHSRPSPTHTIVVDAQAYNSARPAVDGLSVFDSRWGAPALLGSMRWQPQPATSYTVAGGRVISVVPGVSTVAIPAGGFRVVAQGNGNGRLVAAGWHVGTTVARFVAAQAPDLRHVNGALGVGRPTITGGHILGSACGFDVATPRTLFGILPGGRTAVLVAASGQGLTMRESNALMRGIGVASAAMLDGGGSTVMTVRTTGPVQLTVHPYRYEGDRPVPDALGVFAR
ncbi:MAG TPA: phosphodiester glycosidase family protein [Jatrophihabitans sp.]|nr:phosphodiester glycosidase family protein [Jatrophihabitans sp.]